MIPIIGWVRVARAAITSGRETADWVASPAFTADLEQAYPPAQEIADLAHSARMGDAASRARLDRLIARALAEASAENAGISLDSTEQTK